MKLSRIILVVIVFLVIAVVGSLYVNSLRRGTPTPAPRLAFTPTGTTGPARFIGMLECIDCHADQDALWQGSHHDLAMQVVNDETVLGDFNDVTFENFGVVSRFNRRDGGFFVTTEGPDGEMHEYEVSYVFGVTPLQQYLIEFPGGNYQTLPLCWDTRPSEQGGQRWFHIYSNERIAPDDLLFWTGQNQNWNYMCSECHSTNLQKNYRYLEDRYETTWSEINVSCEACHGPGSRHVAWADAAERGEVPEDEARLGLDIYLKDAGNDSWRFLDDASTAARQIPRESHAEVEMCARCHSRRTQVHGDYIYDRPLADTHLPALLSEGLYHADGQIQDEVYVYGSFLQSRMFHNDVSCSDCHDPHSLRAHNPHRLKPADSVDDACFRCHLGATYDTPLHHFHEVDSTGASCVECHMPENTYMVVDPRRDHSIRIPRPDLSVKYGVPNACNKCHVVEEETVQWAADACEEWYEPEFAEQPHYADALYAGRNGLPGARDDLLSLASDEEQPPIVRASAVELLMRYPDSVTAQAVVGLAIDDDARIRLAAAEASESMDPQTRLLVCAPLLDDSVRVVRHSASRILADAPPQVFEADQYAALQTGVQEYVDSLEYNADRAESHLNLGLLALRLDRANEAEAHYRRAIEMNPAFTPAWVNLADLLRALGRDEEGEDLLREALTTLRPDSAASIHHALGLLLIRQGRLPEAVQELALAANLAPQSARYAYVYAVALNTIGQAEQALTVLDEAHQQNPGDQDLLVALITMNRDAGNLPEAVSYAQRLVALDPENASYRALLQQLR